MSKMVSFYIISISVCVLLQLGCGPQCVAARSFVIDYENDCFSKDGQCFQFISGSIHYFRVPQVYWKDRLSKMAAAGLNTVQTYVDWSQHEPYPGVYKFEDMLDVVKFIQTAHSLGLFVIVRAGPYIDAERDMGGFPFWLMQEKPEVVLRSADEYYLKQMDKWFGKLLPMFKDLLYENGGPIISFQVENEYGSYFACDFDYMVHMRDLFRRLLGNNVVLFTTDGSADSFLKCGKTQGLYATVDFGPGADVAAAFKSQRNHEPRGPFVNSEYYPGWMDHWAYPHAAPDPTSVVKTLYEILSMNASVNMYMFHGGTNFGFTNGANLQGTYQIIPTSYDYNAPLSEAGDTTLKYFAIRNTIAKYSGKPLPPVPKNVPKYRYGTVQLKPLGSVLDLAYLIRENSISSVYPLSFEQLGQAYGFVLYETVVHPIVMDPATLVLKNIGDRAYVSIDDGPVGIISRQDSIFSLPITITSGQKLSILVENQGRVCYGSGIKDFKGLLSNVTLGDLVLTNWKITPIPLNNTSTIKKLVTKAEHESFYARKMPVGNDGLLRGAAIYSGNFTVPDGKDFPMDTYVNMNGWYKGVIFINNFNLGRYWPIVGPQVTLYVPKNILKPYPQTNTILVVELEKAPCSPPGNKHIWSENANDCTIDFVDIPIIDGPTPHDGKLLVGKGYKFGNTN